MIHRFLFVIVLISLMTVAGCSQTMNAQTPFKTLLTKANDWELCDATFCKISSLYDDKVHASRYTPEERVVMLVWHAKGIIGNGGFYYLFSGRFDGDPGYRLTADAFKTVGLTRSHEAFEEAFRLFPNGDLPNDLDEREAMLKNIDEDVLDSLNNKVWQDD